MPCSVTRMGYQRGTMSDNPQIPLNRCSGDPQTPYPLEREADHTLRSFLAADSPRVALVIGPEHGGRASLLKNLERVVSETRPELRIRYVGAGDYVTGLVSAIRETRYEEFAQELLAFDFLLIDDIHLLAKKTETLKSLLPLLDPRGTTGKVVLSCCGHPSDIPDIPDCVVDALLSGVVVEMSHATR